MSSTRTPARATPRATPAARSGPHIPLPGLFADVRAAVSQSLGAVALGLVACVALAALGWAGTPEAGTGWLDAVRLGAVGWLLAYAGRLHVVAEVAVSASPADPPVPVDGEVSLPLLGLVLLAGLLSARIGRGLAARTWPLPSLLLVAVVAAVHAGAAWLVAGVTGLADLDPLPVACAAGAAVVSAAGALLGVATVHGGALLDRLPLVVRAQLARVGPGAAVALVAWLSAGALLVATGLVLHLPRVVEVHERLAPGPLGGLVLLLVQLLVLPVLVAWAGALLAGPGVALGDAGLSLQGSAVTDLPALPLLAAVPGPGPFPLWAWAGPLVLVVSGALAAWHGHRHPSSRGATLADRVGDAVAVAALCGAAAVVLGLASRGSVGAWAPLGPDPLVLAAAVTAGVLAGGLAVGGALHLLAGRPLLRRRG
ncbi:DUF6350 family protein [Aquipuribacter nitratireducens]|uniref:DUF6350 family protein n=1 Tax=Aquipuribacter nitratireducens TaxID=650104 RepID=A0ABW0GKL7_9MICO